jgi:hypothetical protein
MLIPVDAQTDNGRVVVRWLDIGDGQFREPFFKQTIENRRQELGRTASHDTGIDEVIAAAKALPEAGPAGFIFHVSRCGSTLVMNALKLDLKVVGLSEPQIFSKLLAPFMWGMHEIDNVEWAQTREELLRALVTIYAHCSNEYRRQVVIKFPSVGILWMSALRSIWPAVPYIVITRNPIEVVVSQLAGRQDGWIRMQGNPLALWKLFGLTSMTPNVRALPKEEFCARIMGHLCDAAAYECDTHGRLVCYEKMTADTIEKISRLFGLPIGATNGTEIAKVMRTYAKDPSSSQAFYDDRTWKQRGATDSVRKACFQWATQPHGRLLTAMTYLDCAP